MTVGNIPEDQRPQQHCGEDLKILLLLLTTVNYYSGLDTLMDNPVNFLHVLIEIPTSF
jgi:hypothetical protein